MKVSHVLVSLLLLPVVASASEMSFRACLKTANEGECRAKEVEALWRVNRSLGAKIETELQACTPHVKAYDYALALRELKASAASWSAFVKHDCTITAATFGEGVARSASVGDCEITHLRTRNERLRQLLADLNGTKKFLLEEGSRSASEQGADIWMSCKDSVVR